MVDAAGERLDLGQSKQCLTIPLAPKMLYGSYNIRLAPEPVECHCADGTLIDPLRPLANKLQRILVAFQFDQRITRQGVRTL